MDKNESVLFKNEWIEVYIKDGWYTCVRGGDGVCVLPFRTSNNSLEILIRLEHTPCHADGPRVKNKFNITSLTGMIDKGYDPISTAEKELYEESGYAALQKDFIGLGWVFPTKHSGDKCYMFAVDLTGIKDPTGLLKGDGTKGEENASCMWISLDKALLIPSAVMLACMGRLLLTRNT
jgi:hypothetical protein